MGKKGSKKPKQPQQQQQQQFQEEEDEEEYEENQTPEPAVGGTDLLHPTFCESPSAWHLPFLDLTPAARVSGSQDPPMATTEVAMARLRLENERLAATLL